MPQPFHVTFDVTHLVARLIAPTPTGIDRIDLAFARHFARADVLGRRAAIPGGLHYGLRSFHKYSLSQTDRLVALAERFWREEPDEHDEYRLAGLADWLATPPAQPYAADGETSHGQTFLQRKQRSLTMTSRRLVHNPMVRIPEGAVYLNIGQHVLEKPQRLRWLDTRPDLKKVFYIYDLLSLDYPEYFRGGNRDVFRRRLETAFHHADAFLVSAETVRERLREEFRRQGVKDRPIHVGHFPSPLESAHDASAPTVGGHPYFAIVGTIEPRKNHLLLLQIWRDMARENPAAPRLLIVGGRGWECEQTLNLLDRAPGLKSHVVEVSAVPSAHLQSLMRGARALLMPTFDEGYGLPVIEALTAGTPAIASDIAVIREIARGCATLVPPTDGPGWKTAILAVANPNSSASQTARERTAAFKARTWPEYFSDVEDFLASL